MAEKDYCKKVSWPYTRLRFHLVTNHGNVEEFIIQIEYNLGNNPNELDKWVPLARFDHNPYSKRGHDIQKEGLHMDLLDADNTKHDVLRGFPSIPVDDAPEYCEKYLLTHAEDLVTDFEKRNNLDGKYYSP